MKKVSPVVSFIIPCFNEARRLHYLEKFYRTIKKHISIVEILLIDDGSTDSTKKRLIDFSKEKSEVQVLSYTKNQGKGYAIKQGLKKASGQYMVFVDIDNLQFIAALSKIIHFLQKGNSFVLANRRLPGSTVKNQPRVRKSVSKLCNTLVRFLFEFTITDTQCGIKGFDKEMAKSILKYSRINRWGFDIECLLIAHRNHTKVLEIPLDWKHTGHSKIVLLRATLLVLYEIISIKILDMQQHYTRKMQKKGFTLVELLVTITIVGILATISVATFQDYFTQIRDAKRASTVKQMAQIVNAEGALNNGRYVDLDNDGNHTDALQELKDLFEKRGFKPDANEDYCYFYGVKNSQTISGIESVDFRNYPNKVREKNDEFFFATFKESKLLANHYTSLSGDSWTQYYGTYILEGNDINRLFSNPSGTYHVFHGIQKPNCDNFTMGSRNLTGFYETSGVSLHNGFIIYKLEFEE